MHPLFLRWCIEHNPNCDVSVATENEIVVGCVFAQRRPDHTFLDDFCVVDERWDDVGQALVEIADETEQLICAPSKDLAKHQWLESSPFTWSSTFFSLRTTGADTSSVAPGFLSLPEHLQRPPAHVFGVFNAQTENGLRVATADGYAIGSAPIVPPTHDPGGPTTVIDRICGDNRHAVLDLVLQQAKRRGDVHVIMVVDRSDDELTGIITELGATQPVHLWRRAAASSQREC
jgi:hypothetical protein